MCGIAGIINFGGQPVERANLNLMTDAIKHRGPNGEGFYVNNNVGFGHRRLAIIDLSDAGAQPMTRFGCTITYNGEIYNYIEIKKELEKKGIVFSSKSDTEVILAAYHVWGTNCVQRFNGMWAFAIHDTTKQQVFFSRDRFGEKPFYYTNQNGRFIFCSEIKGILAITNTAIANTESVLQFLVFEKAEHPTQTFFKSIEKLAPAHNGVCDLNRGEIAFERYYTPAIVDTWKGASEEDIISEFSKRLTHAVNIRLRSDVQVGTCLSGGLDSSAIASIASSIGGKLNANPFCSVTASSIDSASDETPYANAVVEHCGLTGLYVKPTDSYFLEAFPLIAAAQEEPFVSPSIAMQYAVMQKAKQAGLKVLLDGQGADELLLGYLQHIPQVLKMVSTPNQISFISAISKHNSVSWLQMLQLLTYHSHPNIKAKRQLMRWQGLQNELQKKYLNPSAIGKLIGPALYAHEHLFAYQSFELTAHSLPSLLRYEDKNAMAFSVETRLPFLDADIVEIAMNLPVRVLFKHGWSKYLLRKTMEGKLPEAVLWRKKKFGFVAPASFLKSNQMFYSKMILESPILQQLFGRVQVPANNESKWRMVSVAAWEKGMEVEP